MFAFFVGVACGSSSHRDGDAAVVTDAASDAAAGSGRDSGVDAGVDAGADAATDTDAGGGLDSGPEQDAGPLPPCEIRNPSDYADDACPGAIGAVFDGDQCRVVTGCDAGADGLFRDLGDCARGCAEAGQCDWGEIVDVLPDNPDLCWSVVACTDNLGELRLLRDAMAATSCDDSGLSSYCGPEMGCQRNVYDEVSRDDMIHAACGATLLPFVDRVRCHIEI
jgi:hypothetical protein